MIINGFLIESVRVCLARWVAANPIKKKNKTILKITNKTWSKKRKLGSGTIKKKNNRKIKYGIAKNKGIAVMPNTIPRSSLTGLKMVASSINFGINLFRFIVLIIYGKQ